MSTQVFGEFDEVMAALSGDEVVVRDPRKSRVYRQFPGRRPAASLNNAIACVMFFIALKKAQ